MKRVRIGICGTGSIARTHALAISRIPDAQLTAVCSRAKRNAQAFAAKYNMPNICKDHEELAACPEVDAVLIAYPNALHFDVAMAAIRNKKAIWMEKPLTTDVMSARKLSQVVKDSEISFNYLEELPFAPRMTKMIEAASSGAFGNVHFIRAVMRHGGPYSDWFFDRQLAGGGALMDLGCHVIENARRIKGKKAIKSVFAQVGSFQHIQRGTLEDFSIATLTFEDGAIAQIEADWCLKAAFHSKVEIYGEMGHAVADLGQGGGILMYSQQGYGESPDRNRGYSWPSSDRVFEHGYIAQIEHCIACFRGSKTPVESIEDGLTIMEIMAAAYYSARTGKRVDLPFEPESHEFLIDLWRPPKIE